VPADAEWQTAWESSRTTVLDSAGNHFSIMEDHAEETARVVEEWLAP
jgi:hypothetical protein